MKRMVSLYPESRKLVELCINTVVHLKKIENKINILGGMDS